jgi:hypothetical protein
MFAFQRVLLWSMDYGAADDQVACASVNQAELVAELLTHRKDK